jgi:hypothetical protein
MLIAFPVAVIQELRFLAQRTRHSPFLESLLHPSFIDLQGRFRLMLAFFHFGVIFTHAVPFVLERGVNP